jgi:hypothetical protein
MQWLAAAKGIQKHAAPRSRGPARSRTCAWPRARRPRKAANLWTTWDSGLQIFAIVITFLRRDRHDWDENVPTSTGLGWLGSGPRLIEALVPKSEISIQREKGKQADV